MVYYTIEKHNDIYTLWKNVEIKKENKGSFGCYGLISGTLKKCKEYASKNGIRVKGRRIGEIPTWKQLRKRGFNVGNNNR